ncbi:MAG: manganese efflux pump MntP family protein [Clostridiales bacterium]|nr:manganese efflux pump MntP family protein [Clostridiales bacterium]
MELASVCILAVALAMDAFGVSITDGIIVKKIKITDALKIGAFFGIFQFIMPLIGSLLAFVAREYIEAFDHWIAFLLLSFLGVRMIMEAFKKEEEIPKNPLGAGTLFMMAIATSIDALAAGITLQAVGGGIPIWISSLIIGVVAFAFSFAGIFIGSKFGDILGEKAEVLGGAMLIFIGIKTLLEHLFG